jgi:hypothetical protein
MSNNEKLDEILEVLGNLQGEIYDLTSEVHALKDLIEENGVQVTESSCELGDDEFDPTDSDSLVEALQLGVYELTWNSANGQKTMEVTLDADEVDDQLALSEALSENAGSDYIKVWSPDRDGWRSFWISDLVDIVPVE